MCFGGSTQCAVVTLAGVRNGAGGASAARPAAPRNVAVPDARSGAYSGALCLQSGAVHGGQPGHPRLRAN